jgi:uncharacterized small protein (DUF1192 family)
MQMFDDDLEPRKQKKQPRDLEKMSVDELEEYVVELSAEIERVNEEIKKKKMHAEAASSIFKT